MRPGRSATALPTASRSVAAVDAYDVSVELGGHSRFIVRAAFATRITLVTVELRLLGSVEAHVDGRPIALGPRKQRFVLAILALEAAHQVPMERLVDLIWPDGPTPSATHAVRVCVSGLRAAFTGAVDILAQGSGYLLAVDPTTVDAHRFRALLAAARVASSDTERLGLLDRALGLWSGPALGGTAPPATRERLCAGLEEARLAAIEDRVDAQLRLDRHRELVDELADLTSTYPLRERLAGQQMVALYRSGRSGDALAAYRRVRHDLAEHLGLDPGAALQRLEVAILRDDVQLPTVDGGGSALVQAPVQATSAPPPAQLPAAVDGFAGRADALVVLTELAASHATTGQVAVIVGAAGVGKTALATHWAHQRRNRYPDGQLYVNLRGHGSGTPMRPEQALGGFLRALGVPPEQVPLDVDEAAALYRTLLADRRTLVLLDNAVGVDQVRPLLPAGTGCMAVVTSRDRLAGLAVRDGARVMRLETLDADESLDLLTGVMGGARLDREQGSAAEMARLCGHLPLALRIAAAQLVRHPDRSIADLVARLRHGDRLAALEIEGDEQSAVRAAFDLSYVALKPEAQRLFRFAGLLPGSDLSEPAAASLIGRPRGGEVTRSLNQLTDAHLLGEPTAGRYVLHDLMRLYAQTLTDAEDSAAERSAATARLYGFYLRTADSAARLLYPQMQRLPHPPEYAQPADSTDGAETADRVDLTDRADLTDPTAALAWLEAERSNLVAAAERAADSGPRPVAWLLVDTLRGYFWMRRHTSDWLAAGAAALAAATMDGDDHGLAAAHLCLAQAHRFLSHHDTAIDHFAEAGSHASRAGWRPGAAAATGSIANLYRDQGRLTDAAEYHRQARAIFQQIGESGGEAVSLTNLGNVQIDSGALRDGAGNLAAALDIYHRIGADNARAHVLNSLGCAYRFQGKLDAARDHLDQALALHRAAGSREGEADTLNNLAEVHLDGGRIDEARQLAQISLAIAQDAGDRRVEADASHTLAVVERLQGAAGSRWDERALALARETGYTRGEALALIEMAHSRLDGGDRSEALTAAREALDSARQAGYRLIEAEALTLLARVELADGRPRDALVHASEALAIHQQTGNPLGVRRAEEVLGRAGGS